MEPRYFINRLSQNNANYNNPEQAITTANLCETISRDINTDRQRFIYELLQNADDASSKGGFLDIQIDFVNDFIIVSHKGDPFSEIDIESISSAGDGTKSCDNNKTGFKGIGFKSVFSHSNFVIIKSGKYCFKFDKEHWANFWNDGWGSQSDWKAERKTKNKDELLKMPWQIIPIQTEIPGELNELSVLNDYNVSTIIRHDKIEQLKETLNDLFSESQIVLFLRSKKVKVTINTDQKLVLEKSISDGVTYLKRNGIVLSEWLVKTDSFSIPAHVQSEVNADEKSPKKLKDAQRAEISFAIQIDNGKLKAVDKGNRLIFTYLPTSINYDLPFLVNASFLTDAGRQHLHQDTYWNQWLFYQIPIKYMEWISILANKNSRYNRQFLSVLPNRMNGLNELTRKFDEGFAEALQSIAFIPNIQGDLLKISEALYDETGMSDVISKNQIINYINESSEKIFNISSFIPKLKSIHILRQLGLYTFNYESLKGFFKSDSFLLEHTLDENFKLISFLYQQATIDHENDSENDLSYRLKQIPFIFDENNKLQTPEQIYFPSVEFSNEYCDDLSVINQIVLEEINKNRPIKDWLESLGVKEPTEVSFIEKTIIGDTGYIKEENAIKVGRYLFNAHKKGFLTDSNYSCLKHISLLTQKGTLKQAQDCFLADFYEPVLKIEQVSEIDFFVSEKYFEEKDLKSEWKSFFLRIGINEDVDWRTQTIQFDKLDEWKNRFDKSYLEQAWNESKKFSWISWEGWDKSGKGYGFYPHEISFKGLPFIEYTTEYDFSKMFFKSVFEKEIPELYDNILVSGYTGLIPRSLYLDKEDLAGLGDTINYVKWIFNNLPIIPTLTNSCRKSNEVFNNNIPHIKEISGKYLPILDYDGIVSGQWQEIFNFKEQIKIDDYLTILTHIWQEDMSEEEKKENKKRVLLIYEKIAELFPNLHHSEKNKIRDWSLTNKLLAKDGLYYYPNELSIVTIDGFRADNLIYTAGQVDECVLNLFECWGVRVIDKVTPIFSNSMVIQEDLRDQLNFISPLIALLAVEKSKNKKEWEDEYNRIHRKLSEITFYETTEIILSYGNEQDQQERSTFSESNNFYYVGNWYKPRVLDCLIEPLCKFLNIRYAERMLTVLLSDTFDEGLKYLKEKGYNTSLVPDYLLINSNYSERVPNQNNRPYNSSDEDLGRRGEMIVFDMLKQIYSEKYNKPIVYTEEGFEIEGNVDVKWSNKTENTTLNHDFKIYEDGQDIFIDSKATPYDKNVEKVALYISGRELELMEKAQKYLIARVYNTMTENSTVEFVKMQLDNLGD